MKSKYFSWIAVALMFVSLIAFTLALLKAEEGWLGFWGGIIGSAIGVLGAFLILKEQVNSDREALKVQLNEEREQNRKQQIDNTFFNLLEMHVNLKERLGNDKLNQYYLSLHSKIRQTIKTKGNKRLKDSDVIRILQSLYLKYIQQMEEEVIKLGIERNDMPEEDEQKIPYLINLVTNKFQPKTDDEKKIFYLICSDLSGEANEVLRLIKNEYHTDRRMGAFWDVYRRVKVFINDPLLIEQLNLVAEEIEMYKDSNYFLISEKERKEIINTVSNTYYSDLGSYFRLTHRIIKYINDNVEEPKEKNNYLGFFRSTLEENEILIIFYNAYYTERGEGLRKELSKTYFFGKKRRTWRKQ